MTTKTEAPLTGHHVMCDECNQAHPAEYSHEGRFGEGHVYIVMCGEFADYYLTERLIPTKTEQITASKLGFSVRP